MSRIERFLTDREYRRWTLAPLRGVRDAVVIALSLIVLYLLVVGWVDAM